MKRFRVSFWFGLWEVNPFVRPSKEIEVEVNEDSTEKEIILKALNEVGAYPKTFATMVKEI